MFTQLWNCLSTYFSEHIPVFKWHETYAYIYYKNSKKEQIQFFELIEITLLSSCIIFNTVIIKRDQKRSK